MKGGLTKILTILGAISLIAVILYVPHIANAEEATMADKFLGFTSAWGLFNYFIAQMVNAVLGIASFMVTISGALLNVSIVLSLHIKDFVNNTPAIFAIWKTIRDVTGLFFIFYLLFAAFQTILGTGNYGNVIKNIVVAAILINFSFFITSTLIDFSNVISQAIYNSTLPEVVTIPINSNSTLSSITSQATGINSGFSAVERKQGGISDVFANSLHIQSLYDPRTGRASGTTVNDPIKIMFIGAVGIVMMATTALSFLLAAAAFVARLVILLFLLAFSPLWFVGSVIPQLNEYVGDFRKYLTSQLLFMPVYLLLTYASLAVLNTSKLMGVAGADVSSFATGTNWAFGYILLAINFAFVIFMLNLPLMVGLKMGGIATSWIGKKTGKWGADAIWKNIGLQTKKVAYEGTLSRGASALSRSEGFKDWASKKGLAGGLGRMALKNTRAVATDYNKKLEEQVKSRTEFAESLGYDERAVGAMERYVRQMKQQQASYKSAGNTAAANMLKGRIDAMENRIVDKKKERQASYAGDLETKGLISSAPNLWMKVARKDKVAAAKINIGVWQKQLDARKEDLKEAKSDMKQIESDIKADIRQNGAASGANLAEKSRLQAKIDLLTNNPAAVNIAQMGVNDIQNLIDQAKLTK